MLTPIQEYRQWLENYEILLEQLKGAWRFKNLKAIDELNKRILNTQVQIAICARALEKERKAKSQGIISSAISRYIQVRKHTPMDLNSINRNRRK